MKILNIADIDPSAKGGGMNLMVNNLMASQLRLGCEITLLHFSGGSSGEAKKWNGVSRFIRYLRDNPFDFVIIHSIYNHRLVYISLALKFLGVPYYIHSHGSLAKHAFFKKGVYRFAYLPFAFFLLISSKGLIFSNKSEKNNSVSLCKKEFYLPNLINPPEIQVLKAPREGFVYLGKIDFYYKGLLPLLEAFVILKKQGVGFKFDIYGYGENKNLDVNNVDSNDRDVLRLIEYIKKYGLDDSVFFHGPLYEDKFKILQLKSCFILTSFSEAMPLAVSEALSCALPVIVSNQTNMGGYVSDFSAGYVVQPNAVDIARCLDKFIKLTDDEWERMSCGARLAFEKNLSSADLDKYMSVFLEACSGSKKYR